MVKILGIDPSMRSTGLCWIRDNESPTYGLVCAADATTRKLRNYQHPRFQLFTYCPEGVGKTQDPVVKETAKTHNVYEVIKVIEKLLDETKPNTVMIEAIAYGASGRIDELSALNYGIRIACLRRGIPVYAISPSSNKKSFTGNGQATKDMMVLGWEASEKDTSLVQEFRNVMGKHIEDLADAYSLTQFLR